MDTTNNSHRNNSWVTDVAGFGLNLLDQDSDITLDGDNRNSFNNGSDTEKDVSVLQSIKEAGVSENVTNPVGEDVVSNKKRIFEIDENDSEINQPAPKKLRLNVTTVEETDVSSKLNSQPVIQCLQMSPRVTSGRAASFPSKQNTELPSTLQGINPLQVFVDKYFGLRIKKPLVTPLMLNEKMSGKRAIHMDRIKNCIQKGDFEIPGSVIAGVIVQKHATKSKTGGKYCAWTLSDMRENLLTVTVLLFSNAVKEVWKSSIGTVVAIVDPRVMENRSDLAGVATFSVRSPDHIMMWGDSSDFGICEGRKPDGERCKKFVNKRLCNYCVYHSQKEYKKYCGRSELQKVTGGNLRQMVAKKMGWNTPVNKKYTGIEESVPVRKNINLIKKDKNLLASLGQNTMIPSKNSKKHIQETNSSEIKPKTKLQEMLLLTKSASPTSTMGSLLLHHKGTELGKSCTVVSETVKNNSMLIPNKSDTETNNCTVNNKKQRFEKLSLPTEVDCKIQTVPEEKPNNKKFDSKALIDKLMTTVAKENKESVPKHFSLFIDKNSSTSNCDDKNKLTQNTGKYNARQQKKISESILEMSNAIKSNNMNSEMGVGTVLSLGNRSEGGQAKTYKCVSESVHKNVKNKIHPINHVSVKSDHHKLERESSENVDNQNKTHSVDKRDDKNIIKNICKGNENEASVGRVHSMTPKEYYNRSSVKAKVDAINIWREHKNRNRNRKSSEIKQLLSEPQEARSSKVGNKDNSVSVIPDKFKELMNVESTHTQLAESSAMEEYYSRMEQKEKIEDKLLNTYKVECKIVICRVCKYKAGSASELCKLNNHPLVCVKGYRRFFKCSNCSKRTIVYDIFPHYNCVHCNSSSWIRVPVIEVKTTVADLNQLSIRGDEQKFISSHESNTNINLLVPDEG